MSGRLTNIHIMVTFLFRGPTFGTYWSRSRVPASGVFFFIGIILFGKDNFRFQRNDLLEGEVRRIRVILFMLPLRWGRWAGGRRLIVTRVSPQLMVGGNRGRSQFTAWVTVFILVFITVPVRLWW